MTDKKETLLSDTLLELKQNGKTLEDISTINDGKNSCTVEEFVESSDFEFYSGFGTPEINLDLKIFFKDNSVMYRNEYDGSEWWEFIDGTHGKKVFPRGLQLTTDDFDPWGDNLLVTTREVMHATI